MLLEHLTRKCQSLRQLSVELCFRDWQFQTSHNGNTGVSESNRMLISKKTFIYQTAGLVSGCTVESSGKIYKTNPAAPQTNYIRILGNGTQALVLKSPVRCQWRPRLGTTALRMNVGGGECALWGLGG